MNLKLIAIPLALFTLGLTACDVSEPDVDDEDVDLEDTSEVEAELDPETTFYTMTRVVELPDGSFDVSVSKVSLAQQIAEREAEEAGLTLDEYYAEMDLGESPFGGEFAAAISKPSGISCPLSDLRLWDNTGYTGNFLCLTGTGTANLSTWLNGTCYWGDHWWATSPLCDTPVRSVKPGSQHGVQLRNTNPGGGNAFICVNAGGGIGNLAATAGYSEVTRPCPPG